LTPLEFCRAHSFTGENRSFFLEERLFLLSISIPICCAKITARNVRKEAEFFGQIGSLFDLIGSAEGEFATGKALVARETEMFLMGSFQ